MIGAYPPLYKSEVSLYFVFWIVGYAVSVLQVFQLSQGKVCFNFAWYFLKLKNIILLRGSLFPKIFLMSDVIFLLNWGRASNATIQPLIKLQNKAIKIINPTNMGSVELKTISST